VDDSYKPYQRMHARIGAMNLDELLEIGFLSFGGAETVIRDINKIKEAGVDCYLCWFTPQNLSSQLVEKSIRSFAEKVISHAG
jgi:hypothetical protein